MRKGVRKLKKNLSFAVAVFAFVTLMAAPALGQTGVETLRLGEQLYLKGNYAEAFSVLNRALMEAPADKDKATAHILLGMIYLAQNQYDKAEGEFRLAVTLDPQRKLSTRQYPPTVVKLYDQARARNLGSIIVQTNPPEAEVYIDGRLIGLTRETPLELDEILVGRHQIRIVKEGFRTLEREITIGPSERSDFYGELEELDEVPAVIDHQPVASAKEGSSLRVKARISDNKSVEEATLYFRPTGAGKYEPIPMEQIQRGLYEGVVPRDKVTTEGIQYYLTAVDFGGSLTYDGRPESPFDVRVIELDKEAPNIFHTPINASSDATELKITAKVKDNKKLAHVKIFYKRDTDDGYLEEEMQDTSGVGDYLTKIPSVFMTAKKLSYYIEAVDESGNAQYSGRADSPYVITVYRVLPFKDGYIVERKQERDGDLTKDVMVNVGTMKGVEKGQVYTVFDASERVVDPETGMVLAINQRLTGKIRITVPGPASSMARIIKEYSKEAVKKGNMIRLRPSPPTGVGGYSEKFRENTVAWNMNPEPEVEGYIVYRSSTPEGPYQEIEKVRDRDHVQHLDKGSRRNKLEDGKKYYYRVVAYNDEDIESNPSEVGYVIAKGGPNPPTRLSAQSGYIRRIPLGWQRSGDEEAVGYKIFRSDAKDGQYKEISDIRDSQKQEYVDQPDDKEEHGLEDGKTYWYKMVSYNKAGRFGNETEPVSAASRQKPKPPAGFQVVSASVRSVSLAWDRHPDAEIAKYRLYRHNAPTGEFVMIKEISDRSITEYTDKDKSGKDMQDGVTYYYRMTAVNSGGAESEFSSAVSGTTFGPPAGPENVRASSGMVKQAVITWTPSTDSEVAGYIIYRGKSAEEMERIKKIGDAAASSYKDTGTWTERLEDGAVYYYAVRSYNSVDVESANPPIVQALTKPVPSAPEGLTATQSEAGKTTLTWRPNPEPDIQSYRVLRSTNPKGRFTAIASATSAFYEDTGLKNGATYYYRVQALDKDELLGAESETVTVGTKPLPEIPQGLTASAGADSVTLSWRPNPEPDITYYEIYSAGFFGKQKVAESSGTSYRVGDLKPDSSYTFVITAVDSDGLASEASAPVTVNTLK